MSQRYQIRSPICSAGFCYLEHCFQYRSFTVFFLAPNPASYCFVMPWSSLSQVVVPIILGVLSPHLYFSATLFQTAVYGCYFNFESPGVNLVHMTDTRYYCSIYCDEYDHLQGNGSVNTA
jgi:hypothetical protein